ncbi:Qat anti-phage system TatD family nuclease QatD [Algoriphagus algorifonticola]|uniref:Qat anti-phage system TatD family nuclease QatD n=1 Tax=Algoriphagus algorifonticola TaxID=2593007 RepID=UPI0011AA8673|nr:Qat anti-phage system TatD family nuclease QatD [Algoriphagus algorifonticola]
MLDTHCHIDLYTKPELILAECVKKGFPILSMTNLPSHFERGFPFFQNQNKVRQALGMHPLYAQYHKKEFPKFKSNLVKTSYIGEVGLDFSKDGIDTKDIQIQTFESILNIIGNQKKILSIHSRRAEEEVLNLLKKYKIKNAIFHWYSGRLNLIDEIVEEGYYFSVNPAMTKSMSGRKIISKIPKQFILTETDGPFIDEYNLPIKPGQVQTVITFLAKEWILNEDEVKNIILSNFRKVVDSIK